MRDSNILIIDDSNTIRQGIKLILQQADLFEQYFDAASAEDGRLILDNHPIELVICDVIMPGKDGFQFLDEIKQEEEYRDIPVILLTGQESVDKKIQGLELGASDYLTKPFDPGELIARVRVQLKVKRLQDELKVAKQRYKELSITDYLTQTYNRRYFIELYDLEFSRAKRYEMDLSVIIFDLDNFKSVNDTYGHLQGDTVLRELSALVKDEVRSHDVFARYGGEEFILMLPHTPVEGAKLVAQKICDQVSDFTFSGLDMGHVTISIGVAAYDGENYDKSDDLISAADDALYQAKENGKNRVELA